MQWLNEFVTNYPGVMALLLGVALMLLTWAWATLRWFVMREVKRMGKHEAAQDLAIGAINKKLQTFSINRPTYK